MLKNFFAFFPADESFFNIVVTSDNGSTAWTLETKKILSVYKTVYYVNITINENISEKKPIESQNFFEQTISITVDVIGKF